MKRASTMLLVGLLGALLSHHSTAQQRVPPKICLDFKDCLQPTKVDSHPGVNPYRCSNPFGTREQQAECDKSAAWGAEEKKRIEARELKLKADKEAHDRAFADAQQKAAKKAEDDQRAKEAESRKKTAHLDGINVPRSANPFPPCDKKSWSMNAMGNCISHDKWEGQEDARILAAKERIYMTRKNASRMTKRKLGWDNGSFAPTNQPAVIAGAGAWGTDAECPSKDGRRGVVMSACGSGANADCQGHPVQAGCVYYTSKRRIATTNSPQKHGLVAASRWGERLTCPDGQAIVSICGSGSNPNCKGKPNHIQCASFSEQGELDPNVEVSFAIHAAESQWIPNPNWGSTATCPSGMVATGFCGSGGNKDCNGNVIELRCSAVYSYDTPLN